MASKGDIQATRATTAGVANTIAEDLDATETAIDLTSAASFPAGGGIVLVGNEAISYTGKTSNTLTGCTRGANGTTATTHTNGDAIILLQNLVAPAIRLKGISIASDGGGAGLVTLSSNNGVTLFTGDVPTGDVYTLNIPEDGILFPKGIYLKATSNVTAYTLFTDKYSGSGLTA